VAITAQGSSLSQASILLLPRLRGWTVPDQTATAARSYLYVPGDQPARLQRAAERGADALIIDLEDSVAPSAKDDARTHAGRWITAASRSSGPVWVRVNPGQAAADIAATVWPGVTGVVVPKAEPALLAQVGELLGQREPEIGLPAGSLAMLPLIETAAGLLAAPAIASAERVAQLGLGEADLAAELNLRPGPGREELMPLRLQIVLASAAARIAAPVAPVATNFRDLSALTAFETAERDGSGVITGGDGEMVDVAVIRSAREVLARARQ
jgi:citrate lyase subunit beta/citryl-CoA lyase